MYYSEWVKLLKEKLEKKDKVKKKYKKLIDRDSEHYPMELT